MAEFGTGVIVRDVNGNTLARVEDIGATVDPLTRTTVDPVTGCGVRISDNGEWLVVTVALAEDDGGTE